MRSPMMHASLLVLALCVSAGAAVAAEDQTVASFAVEEHLGHAFSDELIHFDVAHAPPFLALNDESGAPVPLEVERLPDGAARVWTVLSLAPHETRRFVAVALARAPAHAQPALVSAKSNASGNATSLVVANDRLAVSLPRLPGALARPRPLTSLPAPIAHVRYARVPGAAPGPWLADGRWWHDGDAPLVKEATTSIERNGPLRVRVVQHYVFADDSTYDVVVELAARQDVALVSEDASAPHPSIAFELATRPGVGADHVLWHNHFVATDAAPRWSLVKTRVAFDHEQTMLHLRPWSFWWEPALSEWAGFYTDDRPDFVGVVLVHPSRWAPQQWAGYAKTELTIAAGPDALDVRFPLGAGPLHREWALTAGARVDNVPATLDEVPRIRRVLLKTSELPLDDVKQWAFDFSSTHHTHPWLLFGADDVARVRRQARTEPTVKAEVDDAIEYIRRTSGARTLDVEGPRAFYLRHYVGNALVVKLPEAVLGSDDPLYGRMLAAAVRGLAQEVRDTFLEKPARPAIGAYGPWFSEDVTRLLLNFDLAAGVGALTPDDERDVQSALVLGAHVLAHPDFWNTSAGLMSANPNMTSSIIVPQALLGVALDGDPEAPGWRRAGEAEVERELSEWVADDGTWIEAPGYEVASLDGIFLVAQALKNEGARDFFADPRLQKALDAFGSLLTPPDVRFQRVPTGASEGVPSAPATVPSVGDTFSGFITPFNGWAASSSSSSRDPAFSRRQQFFWRAQGSYVGSAGRAKGFALALTDPSLPAEPPAITSRALHGFGAVMRSSFTDPHATYLLHRTGPTIHHFHDDANSIVLYAGGAPVCVDFGNVYQPVYRVEAWMHNRVSWEKAPSARAIGSTGELTAFITLKDSVDFSQGRTKSSDGRTDLRSILFVKPRAHDDGDDGYVLLRDRVDGGAKPAYWNLWALATSVDAGGTTFAGTADAPTPIASSSSYTFRGQRGVDLDVDVLSPPAAAAEVARWGWSEHIYVWGPFSEEQLGLRLTKLGSDPDFFTALVPHTAGSPSAHVDTLAGGAAVRVTRAGVVDVVVLDPEHRVTVHDGDAHIDADTGLVRRTRDAIHVALVHGGEAGARGWLFHADGAASLDVVGHIASVVTDGPAQVVRIEPPRGIAPTTTLDGAPVSETRVDVREGQHVIELRW